MKLFILGIIFLYSLIGVQKIIKSALITPSLRDFIILPGKLSFFIFKIFFFDFS